MREVSAHPWIKLHFVPTQGGGARKASHLCCAPAFNSSPFGIQVCLGTKELVGINCGLFAEHVTNMMKLNVNALEI